MRANARAGLHELISLSCSAAVSAALYSVSFTTTRQMWECTLHTAPAHRTCWDLGKMWAARTRCRGKKRCSTKQYSCSFLPPEGMVRFWIRASLKVSLVPLDARLLLGINGCLQARRANVTAPGGHTSAMPGVGWQLWLSSGCLYGALYGCCRMLALLCALGLHDAAHTHGDCVDHRHDARHMRNQSVVLLHQSVVLLDHSFQQILHCA